MNINNPTPIAGMGHSGVTIMFQVKTIKKWVPQDIDAGQSKVIPKKTVDQLKKGNPAVLVPAEDKALPLARVLCIHPEKCNGCGYCELACALFHTGESDTERSRIWIMEYADKGVFLPVACQHCVDAPCKKACPKEAIERNSDRECVTIDYDRCVSCQTCVAACPYGAVRFDQAREIVFKCDLCGGNPQCIHFCETGALTFQDPEQYRNPRVRQSACRIRRC
jgi:Fe-S-cluster-containing hydrogenase component 2